MVSIHLFDNMEALALKPILDTGTAFAVGVNEISLLNLPRTRRISHEDQQHQSPRSNSADWFERNLARQRAKPQR
jgi:hypothetical protein